MMKAAPASPRTPQSRMHDPTEPLVTAARFDSFAEAEIARTALAASGIEALVMTQDQLRFDPLRPATNPGVRLQVRARDLAAAVELIDAAKAG